MNEISKSSLVPITNISGSVFPVSNGTNLSQSGKVLPPSGEAKAEPITEIADIRQSVEKVQAAVAHMNEFIQANQRDLLFSYDPDSGDTVVRVLDRKTQELIRQIPDETFLRISKSLAPDEPMPLINAKA